MSPVNMPPHCIFDMAVHNFGIQELMPHTDETDQVSHITTLLRMA